MTSTWTSEDVAKLERAIATGAKSVQFRDRRVDYRSLDEMRSALREMRRAVAGEPRRTRRYAEYDGGLQ